MRKGAFHLCSRRPRVYEDRPLFISLLNRSQSRSRGSGDAIPSFGAMRRVEEATVRAWWPRWHAWEERRLQCFGG
ncbi:hypothetical protein ES319_A12G018800v1 [Gossypium barbadense]|uniref:Uncharacterized protein n=2 Tax=Gossypium TaxID=3633 RepID=A0A5J5T5H2_GOSBA|nr:hypothetical protein ES319_A12G018800v1 [Gossypium barbadense]TYG88414.1 hypothetical protein ES288_A12G019300v1 [Gossypium darwinii]